MDSEGGATDSGPGRPNKVKRLIDEYDLDGLGEELERKWTADENRWSLRQLADYVNRSVLEQALKGANVGTLDGEIENLYRLLTDDSASAGNRTQARRRLERDGVDVDRIQDDFVTYQSVRTYLKNNRGAEYTPADSDTGERARRTVRQLQSRLRTVTESKLAQLDGEAGVKIGSPKAIVTVQVTCRDCGRTFSFDELADGGRCDCY